MIKGALSAAISVTVRCVRRSCVILSWVMVFANPGVLVFVHLLNPGRVVNWSKIVTTSDEIAHCLSLIWDTSCQFRALSLLRNLNMANNNGNSAGHQRNQSQAIICIASGGSDTGVLLITSVLSWPGLFRKLICSQRDIKCRLPTPEIDRNWQPELHRWPLIKRRRASGLLHLSSGRGMQAHRGHNTICYPRRPWNIVPWACKY